MMTFVRHKMGLTPIYNYKGMLLNEVHIAPIDT